ncbi:MAG: protein kinase [Verrucomicrobiaceae bacterium]|nr:protein kinase [Verrucomicrobiaceae bacterium]
MNPTPSREEALFKAALELSTAEERAALLERECGEDAALRAEVESLLAAMEDAGTQFLGAPAVISASAATILYQRGGGALPATGSRSMFSGTVSLPAGSYTVGDEIAHGGMGTVLEVEDRELGRKVAMKVMRLEASASEQARARFVREATVLARLEHPNIVPIHELGRDEEGRLYYTMKLVIGRTLQAVINGLNARDPHYVEHYTLDRLLTVFRKVCDALAFAHSKGVLHRDLKPENIMVGEFGEVLVMDWGLAKILHEEEEGADASHPVIDLQHSTFLTEEERLAQTMAGAVMGTPQYMSPEQALGQLEQLDERSDIYSLGGILYALLTLRPPVEGKTLEEVLQRVRTGEVVAPSQFGATAPTGKKAAKGEVLEARKIKPLPHIESGRVPAALSSVVMKALTLDKAKRYQSVPEFAADIEKYQSGFATLAEEAGLLTHLRLLVQRHRREFAVGLAAWLLITALGIWFVVHLRAKERETRRQAEIAQQNERKATAAFDELRATAPAFAEQARALAAKEQYADAIAKLDYAIKLRPDAAEFLVAKGDLLQCQLQLAPAAGIYREALRVQPGHARAGASAKLCEELLAAPPAADGKLSRESLAKLHLAMQQQQRPAAELLPVARLLGEEKKLLLDYWLARLKDLPVSAENPLAKRLTVREDGRLALDLGGTKVTDLTPLVGAPLAVLNLDDSTELTDLSPLAGLALIELSLSGTGVADLTPLRDMHTLEMLDASNTQVADLGPLSALRLKRLSVMASPVTGLIPLQKMPLEQLNLRGTRVSDLSPLVGTPITTLWVDQTPVRDFSPLAQMPLEKCYLSNTEIADLTVLRGRPLKELALHGCAKARHYAVLAEIPTLETLLLPDTFRSLPDEDLAAIGALRTHPRLRQLQADMEGSPYYSATQSKDLFWQDWDRLETFFPALRKAGFQLSRPLIKLPDGTYFLNIQNQPLSDLSIIQGAPISKLTVSTCKITDLSPLRGLPLNYLNAAYNPFTDLSPLHGMPLQELYVSGTKISDLSPLAGMPLKSLFLAYCSNVTDISPLLEIPTLEHLMVPATARNVELLRKMPNLRTLDFNRMDGKDMFTIGSTVEDFWKRWDAMAWKRALDAGSITYSAAGLTEQTPEGTKSAGTWTVRIVSKDFSDCSIFQGAGDIRELNLANTAVTDLQPLRGLKLTTLVLPPDAQDIEFLRASSQLQRISFKEDPKTRQPAQTAAEFWKEYDSQGWLRVLRAMGFAIKSARQLPDGTWDLDLSDAKISDLGHLKGAPISVLSLKKTTVTDLRPLHGLPLKVLKLDDTAVTDLRPLQGMPLEELEIRRVKITDLAALRGMALKKLQLGENGITDLEPLSGMALTALGIPKTKVNDLRPLEGMPLEYLDLIGTPVTDLSVLRGMPLTKVRLRQCAQLTDLSPLAEAKGLTSLSLPPRPKDIEFLRAFSKLERLSFKEDTTDTTTPDQTAAAFWKEWDAGKK